jgi:hypothetical protein
LLELPCSDLEALIYCGWHDHRAAVGEQDHVGIRYPIRRWNDGFVARFQRGLYEIKETVLAAG